MPQPVPLYRLDITYQETVLAINMWQLCYQICLQDYEPQLKDMSIQSPDLDGAKLDHALIDHDGEIAWEPLNQKAQLVVSQLIESISREGCQ